MLAIKRKENLSTVKPESGVTVYAGTGTEAVLSSDDHSDVKPKRSNRV